MTSILDILAADPNVSNDLRRVLAGSAESAAAAEMQIRRAAYVAALIRMDWQFDYADDHNVWKKGNTELKRLRAERKEVDPSGELWAKHAHADFKGES